MNVFFFKVREEQRAQVQKYHLNRIFNVVFPYSASSTDKLFLSFLFETKQQQQQRKKQLTATTIFSHLIHSMLDFHRISLQQ